MIPCIAKEWGSNDGGVTWTFQLRDDVKWVDVNGNVMADCTAADFITGLEFVLNFYKNDSANTSMPKEMIQGATEYYEWTKTLSEEEAKNLGTEKFLETVGIEAPDPYTLVYTCVGSKPYFDTLGNASCLYPISQELIDNLGGVDAFLACNNENIWNLTHINDYSHKSNRFKNWETSVEPYTTEQYEKFAADYIAGSKN